MEEHQSTPDHAHITALSDETVMAWVCRWMDEQAPRERAQMARHHQRLLAWEERRRTRVQMMHEFQPGLQRERVANAVDHHAGTVFMSRAYRALNTAAESEERVHRLLSDILNRARGLSRLDPEAARLLLLSQQLHDALRAHREPSKALRDQLLRVDELVCAIEQ